MTDHLCVCPSVCWTIYLPLCLFYWSVCLFVCLSICLSIFLLVCLYVSHSTRVSVCLSVRLSVCLSNCLPACLLPACLPVCELVSLSFLPSACIYECSFVYSVLFCSHQFNTIKLIFINWTFKKKFKKTFLHQQNYFLSNDFTILQNLILCYFIFSAI